MHTMYAFFTYLTINDFKNYLKKSIFAPMTEHMPLNSGFGQMKMLAPELKIKHFIRKSVYLPYNKLNIV